MIKPRPEKLFHLREQVQNICAPTAAADSLVWQDFYRHWLEPGGQYCQSERVLIVAAPHTSNWDFVFGIFVILGINARLRWLGKHTIFKLVSPGLCWLGVFRSTVKSPMR